LKGGEGRKSIKYRNRGGTKIEVIKEWVSEME
jgi:hypothetical protein